MAKNYVDELLTKYGRPEPTETPAEPECPYCSHFHNDLLTEFSLGKSKDTMQVDVQGDRLSFRSWDNGELNHVMIEYCPMCGRKL
ncbi:hypothetical protein [Loigolactobacillus rennini]|uniref:hypothetical protein n=1 Tax=Loigolactobacillus rennini TaxID=238013 RepID=UPI00070E8AD6|nr:hypothetical protein [Loigolactobacillus rennini]